MASRSSVKNVSSQVEADDKRFELEPLEPRLLLSADPLGTQVSADLSTFQPDRDLAGGVDADSINAFISALPQSYQDSVDTDNSLPAALDLAAVDVLNPVGNDTVLEYLTATSDSLLDGDRDDSVSTRHEIIFVDIRTPDYEALLADVHQSDSGIRYDIIMLDAETDGIDQISDVLNAYQNLDAVHIISHGDTGAFQLGDTWLQSANIEQYASRIADWQDNLGSEADLLFYGCNLAGSETGKHLVEQLSQLTGADVAASDDLTGGARLGGDWELEHQVGDIETGIAVSDTAQQYWDDVLVAHVSQTSSNASALLDNANPFGQSFEHTSGGGTYDIDYLGIELDRDGATSGTITVSLRDGWNGTVLASATRDASTLNDNPTLEMFDFAAVSLNDGQKYMIQVDIGPSTGVVNYHFDSTDPYAGGQLFQGGAAVASSDLLFKVGLNSPPVFQNSGPFNVDEGAAAATVVGNVDADDGEGGAVDAGITYSITANVNPDADGNDAFKINVSTGEITVNDADDIDYEINTSLTITVQADDGIATTSTDVTIDVNDVAPSITAGGAATIKASDAYTLDLKAIEPGTNNITSYTVNWGDGTITTEAYTGPTTTVSHIYNTAGFTHNITVAATDTGGTTWTASDLVIGDYSLFGSGDDIVRVDGETGNTHGTFDSSGGELNTPYASVVGPDGDYYVTGYHSGNIVKFAADGSYLGEFSADALFNKPVDMAWGSDGHLYVANYGADNILRITPDGSTVSVWGTSGSGTLNGPTGLAFGPDGDLYVVAWDNDRLVKFDGASGGAPTLVIGSGLNDPEQIEFDAAGNLYIAHDNEVAKWDGTVLTSYFTHTDISRATGLTFGPDGQLYVASYSNDKILRYDGATGEVFADDGPGGLDQPEYLTFTPDHQVTVTGNQAPSISVPADVFINALHYDNTGFDFGEGVELMGLAGTDLSGWSLVFYSGADGLAYNTHALAGIIPNQADNFGTLAFAIAPIQNGDSAADGIALVNASGDVVEFISYEGTLTAADGPAAGLTSTDIGVAEDDSTPIGYSLQLTGTGSEMTWMAASPSTSGALNTGQNVFAKDSGTEDTDQVYNHAEMLTLLGASDPDDADAVLTVNISNVVNGTLTMTGGTGGLGTTFTFTPDPHFNGQLTFDYQMLDDDLAASAIGNGIITIAPVNDDPTGSGSLTMTSVDDNAGAVNLLGALSVSDVDAGENDLVLRITLSDPTAGTITGGGFIDQGGGVYTASALTVAQANTALDDVQFTPVDNSGSAGSFTTDISVDVDDQGGAGYQSVLSATTVTINRVNDAPTATNLSSTSSYNEGDASVAITDIVVSDVDAGETITTTLTLADTATGSLSANDGATYTAATGVWTITDSVANVNTALANLTFTPLTNNDLDTTISVVIDDGDEDASGPLTGTITLDVTPINDAPAATNLTSTSSYNEGDASVAITDIVVSDVDVGETITATLTLTNTATGSLSANDGASYIAATGVWTITDTLANVNTALANLTFTPTTNNEIDTTISVVIDDGDEDNSGPLTGTITLDVTPVNDAPTATNLTSTSIYNEGDASVAITDIVVSDIDAGETITATLTLTNTTTGSLSANDGASYTVATGVWTITDTVANVNTALANLTFTPTTNNEIDTTISVVIDDGDEDASGPLTGTITLDVTPVNDAPTATNLNSTSSYNEGDASVAITDIVVSDVDAGETVTATLTLADTATGSLSANDGATYNAVSGVWTITDTVANVNTALANLTFTPLTNNDLDTTISVVIDDGDEDASGPLTGTITLDATPVNDAPTATNLTSTSSYNEGDASVAITDIVVSDIDAGETITATLTLTNTATGSLSANDGASYTAATGVWTITDTVANVNTALANLTFTPLTNNDLDTTISVVIDDGDEDASGPLTGTITLDVTPVNDLPTSADNSVDTVENVAISFAPSDFAFTDVETAGMVSLRIDSLPGNGVLQNGTVVLNPGDVVLAADLVNLTYTPNTDYNGSDSFTFSVSDGTDYSISPNTMTVTVNAVNTVPTSMDSMTSTNEDEAKTFTAADFPFADVESASIVALRIDALPSNGVLMNGATPINVGDVVTAADLVNFSFTPAADFNGTDSFAFSVYDGIDYSAASNTMTIAVNAINDIPTSGDFSISTTEDVPRTFAASDFPFADAEINDIVALRIDAVPTNGLLMNGTTVLNTGDVVMADDLDQLRYTPNAGFNGSDSFGFSVSDGAAYSSVPSTVTASVTPAPAVPAPAVAALADPIVVVRPDLPVVNTVADPVVAETTVEEAETVTEAVTDDEPTSQDEPVQAAEASGILVPPDGLDAPQATAAIPDHDSGQRVSVDSAVKVNLQGLMQAIKIQLPGWDNLLLETGDLFDPMNLLESNDYNRDMDQLREEVAEDETTRKMKAGTGVVLTTSLTVGYVAYLVRGGVLLSSVLSTLPVWNFIDPTPILASLKSGNDDDSDADESLESLVTQQEQSPEIENEEVNAEDKG